MRTNLIRSALFEFNYRYTRKSHSLYINKQQSVHIAKIASTSINPACLYQSTLYISHCATSNHHGNNTCEEIFIMHKSPGLSNRATSAARNVDYSRRGGGGSIDRLSAVGSPGDIELAPFAR